MALFELVNRSRLKHEEDVRAVQDYLSSMPTNLRLLLAQYWDEYWYHNWDEEKGQSRSLFSELEESYNAQSKFLSWRVVCFMPDVKNAPLILKKVLLEDSEYGARAMRHIVEECVQPIKNSRLTISMGKWPKDRANIDIRGLFNNLLSRCLYLTEVYLFWDVGDLGLQAVGEMCKNLRKLTTEDSLITDVGFKSFARNQWKNNPSLRELYLKESSITIVGLSMIWKLPLPIETLHCTGKNMGDNDHEVESLLQCPNGPTRIKAITVIWDGAGIPPSEACKVLMTRWEHFFPSLQRMVWENPHRDFVTDSTRTWEAVRVLNQKFKDEIDLRQLASTFPKLFSMNLMSVKPLTTHNPLKPASFEFLRKFHFFYFMDNDDLYLPFDTFSSIMAEAKNIREVTVEVMPEFVKHYSDGPFCRLFSRLEHLRNLETLVVTMPCYNNTVKLPLTIKAVSCVLQTCPDIKLFGNFYYWSLDDPEDVLKIGGGRYRFGGHYWYKSITCPRTVYDVCTNSAF